MTLRYSTREIKPENRIWTPWLSQIKRPFDIRCGVPGGLERLWFGTIRARRKGGEGGGRVGSWVDWFVERTWIYVVVPLRMPEPPCLPLPSSRLLSPGANPKRVRKVFPRLSLSLRHLYHSPARAVELVGHVWIFKEECVRIGFYAIQLLVTCMEEFVRPCLKAKDFLAKLRFG